MDDQKYITSSYSEMKENDCFYTDDIDNVKFEGNSKFDGKILVWYAISEAEFIS